MNTKSINLTDVLSVYTGIMLPNPEHETPINAVYQVMDHVTGQSLMTHHLAILLKPVAAELARQFPFLVDLTTPERGNLTSDAYLESLSDWVSRVKAAHGERVNVAQGSGFEKVSPFDGIPEGKKVMVVEVDE